MNEYEEKQVEKQQYYQEKAAKARIESNAECHIATKMGKVIPMGQPILVGHYSEGRDRRYRDRMGRHMEKSIDALKRAEYYEQKAASVGKGGISSDDPDAISKLQEKLDRRRKKQDYMKQVIKAIPKYDDDALRSLGLDDEGILKVKEPDFCGRIGFPAYELSSNNAEIHRLEKRILHLSSMREREPVCEKTDLYEYREEENRCQFVFDSKPGDEVRAILKRFSYKWSARRGAWVRKISNNALYAAKRIKEELSKL